MAWRLVDDPETSEGVRGVVRDVDDHAAARRAVRDSQPQVLRALHDAVHRLGQHHPPRAEDRHVVRALGRIVAHKAKARALLFPWSAARGLHELREALREERELAEYATEHGVEL